MSIQETPRQTGIPLSQEETPRQPDGSYLPATPLSQKEGNCVEILSENLSENSPSQPSSAVKGWRDSDGVALHFKERKLSLPSNPALKQRARELRTAGVLSEVLFWNQVKNKHIFGLDFDRQKIIGNYIVDFYIKRLGVAVEIDGSSHDDKAEYDAVRDEYLHTLGIDVLHYTDNDVKQNLDGVLYDLKTYIVENYAIVEETPRQPDRSPLPATPLSRKE